MRSSPAGFLALTSHGVRTLRKRLQLARVVAFALCLAPVSRASPQELRQSIDPVTFFETDPAWILLVQAGFGHDGRLAFFPLLGVRLGYRFADHTYFGLGISGRITEPVHLRVAPRLGVMFEAASFTFGFGTSLGLFASTRPRELGLDIVWALEVRYRLNDHHFLNAFVETDLLFEQLGFAETRVVPACGLGWSVAF